MREQLTLRNRKPQQKGIREYINQLKPQRRMSFYSELSAICIAYYLGLDWRMTRIRISNRYTVGSLKDIREYILSIDKQMIDLIADDFIKAYRSEVNIE